MAKAPALSSLSVDALLKLREDVARTLTDRSAELHQQLSRLNGKARGAAGAKVQKVHSLKGKKLSAKYRDGKGNSWAGRGLQPAWLREALAAGKKLEEFAVAKRGRKPKVAV